MNKIKLPSMVEYVKLQKENLKDYSLLSLSRKFELCDNFANFLSQQPNIGMFVPAVFEDGEWRILNKPARPWQDSIIEEGLHQMYKEDLQQYKTALDNVIFEGFEVDYSDNKWVRLKFDKLFITFYESSICVYYPFQDTFIINTIEQLTKHNLTLTPKFAKELGVI